MKTSLTIQSIAAAVLLSTTMMGTAQADSGYFSITFGDQAGNRTHYRHVEREYPRPARWAHHAAPSSHAIDREQAQLRARIQTFMRRGDLSPRELARLQADLRQSEYLERRFEADGHLDKRERTILRTELAELERDIWQASNDRPYRDDDRRGPPPHR